MGAKLVANETEVRAQIAELEAERQALAAAIDLLHQAPAPDMFALQRLKKRKLLLKDSIARLRSLLIPDLNA